MITYLEKVRGELKNFEEHTIVQVLREENCNVDALARLATSQDAEMQKVVPFKTWKASSIKETSNNKVLTIYDANGWIAPI